MLRNEIHCIYFTYKTVALRLLTLHYDLSSSKVTLVLVKYSFNLNAIKDSGIACQIASYAVTLTMQP